MKFSYLFCLLFVCASCIQNKPPAKATNDTVSAEPVVKDSVVYYPIKDNRIAVDLKKPQQASLFDYFRRIELIPLETSNKALIGYVGKIIFHQNRFYVFDEQQRILLVFDESGKFIQQIGRGGQGPGEYLILGDIFINPFNGYVELLDWMGWILRYDLSGKFIERTARICKPSTDRSTLTAVHYFTAISEKKYVFFAGAYHYRIIYFDMNEGAIVREEFSYDKQRVMYLPCFYEYHGQWYFYFRYSNQVYEIGQDSLRNGYVYDFGKLTYDMNKMTYFDGYEHKSLDEGREIMGRIPYRMSYQGQNNRYVMAELLVSGEKYANVMYDKSMQESKYVEKFDEVDRFCPYIVTNEYVLSYCKHGELPDYVSKEILDEQNRQKYEKLINTVGEELNPVIIKYYFK